MGTLLLGLESIIDLPLDSCDHISQFGVGEWWRVGELNFFPINLKNIAKLQTIHCHILWLIPFF